MSLLNDAAFPGMREALEVVLNHTCTLTPVTTGAEDNHGVSAKVPGTPVTGVTCLYATVQQAARTEHGLLLTSVPTIMLRAAQQVEIGYLVTQVLDQTGQVLAPGPLRIDRVHDDTAGLGAPLLPTYALRGVEVPL